MPHDHDISHGLIRTRQVDFHPKLKSWVPTPPTIRVETFEDTFKHQWTVGSRRTAHGRV